MLAVVEVPADADPRERFTRTRLSWRWAVDVQEMNRGRRVVRIMLFASPEDDVGCTTFIEAMSEEARARLIRALGGRP